MYEGGGHTYSDTVRGAPALSPSWKSPTIPLYIVSVPRFNYLPMIPAIDPLTAPYWEMYSGEDY